MASPTLPGHWERKPCPAPTPRVCPLQQQDPKEWKLRHQGNCSTAVYPPFLPLVPGCLRMRPEGRTPTYPLCSRDTGFPRRVKGPHTLYEHSGLSSHLPITRSQLGERRQPAGQPRAGSDRTGGWGGGQHGVPCPPAPPSLSCSAPDLLFWSSEPSCPDLKGRGHWESPADWGNRLLVGTLGDLLACPNKNKALIGLNVLSVQTGQVLGLQTAGPGALRVLSVSSSPSSRRTVRKKTRKPS